MGKERREIYFIFISETTFNEFDFFFNGEQQKQNKNHKNEKKKWTIKNKVSIETHPNWFCKTGYAVLSPAAAAAANGNPVEEKNETFWG